MFNNCLDIQNTQFLYLSVTVVGEYVFYLYSKSCLYKAQSGVKMQQKCKTCHGDKPEILNWILVLFGDNDHRSTDDSRRDKQACLDSVQATELLYMAWI
jgi:hypothetical protein